MDNLLIGVYAFPGLEVVHKPQEKTYVVFRPQCLGIEPLKLGEDITYQPGCP